MSSRPPKIKSKRPISRSYTKNAVKRSQPERIGVFGLFERRTLPVVDANAEAKYITDRLMSDLMRDYFERKVIKVANKLQDGQLDDIAESTGLSKGMVHLISDTQIEYLRKYHPELIDEI